MRTRALFPYILLCCSVVVLTSCDAPLDLAPVSSIGVEGFWETPDQVQGAVTAMYTRLRAYDEELFLLGTARSGEVGETQFRNAAFRIKYFNNTLSANNADMEWQTPYKVISLANLVINNAPQVEFPDQSDKNRFLAEAYAMRAFVYFVLARTWGDVPIFTEEIKGYSPESIFNERAPVEDVFALIKSDLDEAISLFPTNAFPPGRARWSQPAANTLKGNVYLWTARRMDGGTEDFETALNALQEAESANLQLQANFGDIFAYSNKGNSEIIFALHFDETETGGNLYVDMWGETSVILDSDSETAERLAPGGGGWFGPTEHIVSQFSEDDLRKDESLYDVYHYSDDGDSTLAVRTVTKYEGIVESGVRRFVDDIVIYRYADLLLMIAEAKNALGMDPSAEINMVRERAYGNAFEPDHEFVPRSIQENDETILRERMLELAFEGKRWWDVVRFGEAYEQVPSLQGREGEVPLLWPLSEDILTRNSRLNQTDGY